MCLIFHRLEEILCWLGMSPPLKTNSGSLRWKFPVKVEVPVKRWNFHFYRNIPLEVSTFTGTFHWKLPLPLELPLETSTGTGNFISTGTFHWNIPLPLELSTGTFHWNFPLPLDVYCYLFVIYWLLIPQFLYR